jgi:hypothetical protein
LDIKKEWVAYGGDAKPIPGLDPRVDPKTGRDCEEVEVRNKDGTTGLKKACYGDRAPELAYSDKTKDFSHEVYLDKSGKVEGPAPADLQKMIDDALVGTKETRDSVCVYYMQDRPMMEGEAPFHVKYDGCFTGQIWPICPRPAEPLKEDKFRLFMSGWIMLIDDDKPDPKDATKQIAGQAIIQWDTPGTPQVVPKCDPPK